ncbi:hypothetical protein FNV43_RR02670 [Rhamnella rubrinervis]|uniref:Uncharacterized protein n=1 Tax=Rhamnella rubrinervis TaxID=2594499 RepID=A0A8K0HS03_9ROSA|nr:hypothetical protein FNV43_RR02670 [Rhamnella rubrinervis]
MESIQDLLRANFPLEPPRLPHSSKRELLEPSLSSSPRPDVRSQAFSNHAMIASPLDRGLFFPSTWSGHSSTFKFSAPAGKSPLIMSPALADGDAIALIENCTALLSSLKVKAILPMPQDHSGNLISTRELHSPDIAGRMVRWPLNGLV